MLVQLIWYNFSFLEHVGLQFPMLVFVHLILWRVFLQYEKLCFYYSGKLSAVFLSPIAFPYSFYFFPLSFLLTHVTLQNPVFTYLSNIIIIYIINSVSLSDLKKSFFKMNSHPKVCIVLAFSFLPFFFPLIISVYVRYFFISNHKYSRWYG